MVYKAFSITGTILGASLLIVAFLNAVDVSNIGEVYHEVLGEEVTNDKEFREIESEFNELDFNSMQIELESEIDALEKEIDMLERELREGL